jgi:ElaB/YqjD/DUF883 family membrane-anchored ribosome-binding protein
MTNNTNEPFPPISPNGKATLTDQATSQQSESDTQQADRPRAKEPAQGSASRTQTRQQKATPGQDGLTPTQQASARVSGYISKYPYQAIGGLLAVLLLVVGIKAFYQGKNWKAKRMAEEAYYVANQYARNNGTNLYPYLSRAFRQQVRQLPGLLPLSMQTATRGGTITGAESIGLREITPDSVVVELSVTLENGREEKRYQPLVYQKDQWRLGLAFSR